MAADSSMRVDLASGGESIVRRSPAWPRRRGQAPRHLVLRWAFALFLFSIPFESAEFFSERSSFTVAKLVGYAFFGLCLLQPRLSFRRPPAAFWLFASYWFILMLYLPFLPEAFQETALGRLFSLVQMLLFLWVAYGLLQQDGMVRMTLWSLALSCATLAILEFLGVSGTARPGGRMAMFGDDPNTSAAVLSLGLLAMVGLIYGRVRGSAHSRLLVWALISVVAFAQVRTGSRGGVVALTAGLLVIVLRRGSVGKRIRNALIVVAMLALVTLTTLSSENLTKRWQGTVEEGSMAGRERIYPLAWQMFLERPLIGWGPVVNYYVLGKRTGNVAKDTHNVYLAVLTETGLVGALVYFIALALSVRAAWIARAGPQGVLPLALVVAVLVVNMSLTWHNRKLYWFVLAFALASAEVVSKARRRDRRRPPISASPHQREPYAAVQRGVR